MTAIDDLTREHDLVVNLIGEVRAAHAATDTARMAELARQITDVLEPHTHVEEHGLFPVLAADFPDQVTALQAEHRHIEVVLGEAADGAPADPTWPARLVETLNLLREHILKEQDGVFPRRAGQPQPRGLGRYRHHPGDGGHIAARTRPLTPMFHTRGFCRRNLSRAGLCRR